MTRSHHKAVLCFAGAVAVVILAAGAFAAGSPKGGIGLGCLAVFCLLGGFIHRRDAADKNN